MIQPIILAAGRNKRMRQKVLKSLHQLNGKTTLERILDTVESLDADLTKPIIVVSPENKKTIQDDFGKRARVITAPPKGTAYAVKVAKRLSGNAKYILPLYGDHPFIQTKTLKRLISSHLKSKAKLTLCTLVIPNFKGINSGFKHFGRIVRSAKGVPEIKEYSEASVQEKKIREVNPALLIANASWIWSKLNILKIHPNGEIYLTDLLKMAAETGSLNLIRSRDFLSSLAYNSPEDLNRLSRLAKTRNL